MSVLPAHNRFLVPCFTVMGIAACIVAHPAWAGFTNGNFETGTFAGWTLEYGLNNNGTGIVSNWSTTLPSGHPVPAIVTAATSGQPPYQTLAIVPYQGTYMARINDVDGGFHATRLSQSIVLGAGDLVAGNFLNLQWGAVLSDPGHPPGQQPFFEADVIAGGTTIATYSADASLASAPGSGWVPAGHYLDGSILWYKKGTFCVDVSGYVGQVIQVQLMVADCGAGGHGGYAYLDDLRISRCGGGPDSTCVAPPANMVAWWPLDETDPTAVKEIIGRHDGVGINTPSPVPGKVRGAFEFSELYQSAVQVPDAPQLNFGSDVPTGSGNFSIDAWINATTYGDGIPFAIVSKGLNGGPGYRFWCTPGQSSTSLSLRLADGTVLGSTVYSSSPVAVSSVNAWAHVAVTVDRQNAITFYVNGEAAGAPASPSPPADIDNADPLYLGFSPASPFGPSRAMGRSSPTIENPAAALDEVEIFGRVLDPSEILALFEADSLGKCEPDSGSVSGKVFFDTDRNGTFNAPDYGITSGQLVVLHGPGGLVRTTAAAPDGSYSFSLLPAGTMTVTTEVPAGWILTTPPNGAQVIHLDFAQDANGVDFGEWQCATGVSCVTPPQRMTAWFPLDETNGPSLDAISGLVATWSGTPSTASGRVGSSLQFSAYTDFLTIPDAKQLNFGSGDFSIDAWIRTSAPPGGVRTIVDKRVGSPYRGYSLYLYNGTVGCQLADGTFANFGSATRVDDGQWHLVGVSVKRNTTDGGKLYVDGAVVATFNPTARSGSLTNTASMKIGQAFDNGSSAFAGDIDELELFNRVLSADEMGRIYNAGAAGKCRISGYLPPWSTFCPKARSGPVPLTICNHSSTAQSFAWTLSGLPTSSPDCPGLGPTEFDPPSGHTEVLAPGACVTVKSNVTVQPSVPYDTYSCFQATIVGDTTGECGAVVGAVQVADACLTWANGTSTPIPVIDSALRNLTFKLTNGGSSPITIRYAFTVAEPDTNAYNNIVSLNGLAPGTDVPPQSISIPVDGTVSLNVQAQLNAIAPLAYPNVVLLVDLTESGPLLPFATQALEWSDSTGATTGVGGAWSPTQVQALAVPNPSRSSQEIRFSIQTPQRVDILLLDVSGRIVRRLPLGPLQPGEHSVLWDGRDAGGARVRAGAYFARIQSGHLVTIVKVVQIR